MTDYYTAIKEIVKQECPHYELPTYLNKAAYFIEKVHFLKWAIQDWTLVKKGVADERIALAAGFGATAYAFSDLPVMAQAVKIAITTECILALKEQHTTVYHAYQACRQALFQKYPAYVPNKQKLQNVPYWAPSLQVWIDRQCVKRLQKLMKIMRCVLQLIGALIELSLCYREVYLVTQGNSYLRCRACIQLAVRIETYWQQVTNDSSLLLRDIAEHRLIAEKLLKKIVPNQTIATFLTQLMKVSEQACGQSVEALPFVIQEVKWLLSSCFNTTSLQPIRIQFRRCKPTSKRPTCHLPAWRGQLIKHPKKAEEISLSPTPGAVVSTTRLSQLVKTVTNLATYTWKMSFSGFFY